MPTDKPETEHLEWLVDNRAANQRVSVKLYQLFRDYPAQMRAKPFGPEAQMLVAISFSLWRSAFLSDKTALVGHTSQGAELFLEEMLMNNAIAYSQDRKSKDWTFNYYATNALYRLQEYNRLNPDLKLGKLHGLSPKERWERLQSAFAISVNHFAAKLKLAVKNLK